MTRQVEVAIIGAGTAGLYAMSQVARRTRNFLLIDGGILGTTCARVGCMPSKVLIQVAEDYHRRNQFEAEGINGSGYLSVDMPAVLGHVRALRDRFVAHTRKGSTDRMGERLIQAQARFLAPGRLQVGDEVIEAKRVILATGSAPLVPEAWAEFGERILTSDSLFEQHDLPEAMAVIGLGAQGLELGQALSRLDVQVSGFDVRETLAGLRDPVVNEMVIETLGEEFPLYLGRPAELAWEGQRIRVSSGEHTVLVDKLLLNLGRRPRLGDLGLENLGIDPGESLLTRVNAATLQVGDLPIYLAGDASNIRPLFHEAADEGRMAGINAGGGENTAFRRKAFLGITFCDPNLVSVGDEWQDLDLAELAVGEARLGPAGRAPILGKERGIVRVYANKSDGRLLGGSLFVPHGEHLGHQLAWAVQQGLTVMELMSMPFYHPTMEEILQAALQKTLSGLDSRPSGVPGLRPIP